MIEYYHHFRVVHEILITDQYQCTNVYKYMHMNTGIYTFTFTCIHVITWIHVHKYTFIYREYVQCKCMYICAWLYTHCKNNLYSHLDEQSRPVSPYANDRGVETLRQLQDVLTYFFTTHAHVHVVCIQSSFKLHDIH